MSNGNEKAAMMTQMSMRHSFHVDAFASFAYSPEKNDYFIVAVVVNILLLVFPCRQCYKMEGMGEWHRLRPGGSKGSKVELVIGVRRSGAPVIPEILLRLRDFS